MKYSTKIKVARKVVFSLPVASTLNQTISTVCITSINTIKTTKDNLKFKLEERA